jgi:uncharacterized protein YyaL (SSP411 family)
MSSADPALPGIVSVSAELVERLAAAARAKGDNYRPRTHHFTADRKPKYVNRLILETSPYLLQHAHNPVNWYPWGEEAFERSRREDKPILLSVGYSTCHWCHVMERESFEDEEIARYINQHFIAIKVDREERPDVDDIYMKAVQMLSRGSGGWPMTLALTSEREPFFGGTYFAARDGDRGSRKGFLTILKELVQSYRSDRENVVAKARVTSQRIQSMTEATPATEVPGPEVVGRAAASVAQSFDPIWGGFGHAPKFPTPVKLELLARYHRRTADEHAKHIVLHTLESMAAGGIHDHVGGGFHRYATDRRWLVPHFEKMLYDNAQLVPLYLWAYQVTGRAQLAQVARDTLDYVGREMTAPEGGFYSATDADSPTPSGHAEEGYFFTWTSAELEEALGAERAKSVSIYFDVTAQAEFEGRNVLHTPRALGDVAAELGMNDKALRAELASAKQELYASRAKRPPPVRDDKVLASWNGLMISAFAQGAFVLGHAEYAERARRAAHFVLQKLRDDGGRMRRSFMEGQARHNAYLDDYAFMIQGLLDLYESTFELKWLEEAIALQATLDRHHFDEPRGGYFMTSADHEALLARDKPVYDGAEPSGNSVAVLNLLRLAELLQREGYRRRAEKCFAAFASALSLEPGAMTKMLSALEHYLDIPLEVIIVRPDSRAEAEPLVARLRSTYLPNRMLTITTQGDELTRHARLLPVLDGKRALYGKTTAFVCERGRCELPTSDPAVFARQIAKTKALGKAGTLTALSRSLRGEAER